MKDIKSIADANRVCIGEPVHGVAIFAKVLKCYQMKHSDDVAMGQVLVLETTLKRVTKADEVQDKLYVKHGAFNVQYAGHDANSDILVTCFQVCNAFAQGVDTTK